MLCIRYPISLGYVKLPRLSPALGQTLKASVFVQTSVENRAAFFASRNRLVLAVHQCLQNMTLLPTSASRNCMIPAAHHLCLQKLSDTCCLLPISASRNCLTPLLICSPTSDASKLRLVPAPAGLVWRGRERYIYF